MLKKQTDVPFLKQQAERCSAELSLESEEAQSLRFAELSVKSEEWS